MLTFITLCAFVLCAVFFACHVYDLTCANAHLRGDRDTLIKQSWQLGVARYQVSKLLCLMQDNDYGNLKPHIERLKDLKDILNAGEYRRLGEQFSKADCEKWAKRFRESFVSAKEDDDIGGGLAGTTCEATGEPTHKGTGG